MVFGIASVVTGWKVILVHTELLHLSAVRRSTSPIASNLAKNFLDGSVPSGGVDARS
jgi:hypothetical protein